MSDKNVQILLASRPKGWVTEENFKIVETEIPAIGEGEILVKNNYLSLDPYMRGRMNESRSYAASQNLDEVMIGGTVGEVVESHNPKFSVGDIVLAQFGWQKFGVSKGKGLQKIEATSVPQQAYLGVTGMPGITAYVGLLEIGQPKEGETVVVSAAAGAVGSVVGQIAKMKGCRAIGIAGGKEKCDYVVNELGFDVCIDYKAEGWRTALKEATPNFIDVYFENVGGEILDAVLLRLNAFARIPLCGVISQYNATEPYGVRNFAALLTNRVKLQGFIVSEFPQLWEQATKDLVSWVSSGKLKYRETVTEGLENAPRAFIGLLKGENFGKQLVKIV
jgi:hypothetical protein